MSDPLLSPKLKIKRAKTLIQEIDMKIFSFLESNPVTFECSPHPSIEGKSVEFIRMSSPIPEDIAPMVGDAIHNMRTSLDHLACCLAVKNGKSMKGVYFPFAPDLAAFQKSSPEKIRKLPEAARRLILKLAPHGEGFEFLYLLHKLDLSDKHQTLALCTSFLGRFEGSFVCDGAFEMNPYPTGSLEDGVYVCTFDTGVRIEHNIKMSLSVAFKAIDEITCIDGKPVLTILNDGVVLIERIIGIFERLFFK